MMPQGPAADHATPAGGFQRHRLVGPETFGSAWHNINGPSCIEVPEWSQGRLGRYYLYFAHHRGSEIRLAYGDELRGKWKTLDGGVLRLTDVLACRDHIASPEVVVDHARREFMMYFHGPAAANGVQLTYLATSKDGLNFVSESTPIAASYLRVVRWRNVFIGMSKGGRIWVSTSGRGDFRLLPRPAFPVSDQAANRPGDVRHVALDLEGDRLWTFYSRIGDAPEHIRLGYIDLLRPRAEWKIEYSVTLLEPKLDWEGANLPVLPSKFGMSRSPENALRDPAVLKTREGRWLFYSFAGESGIAATPLPDLASWYRAQQKTAVWTTAVAPEQPTRPGGEALRLFSRPGALEKRLAELDQAKPQRRLFVMGCGRSGTWLLTSLMTCFSDTEVVAKEFPVEQFGLAESSSGTLVLKRDAWSYQRLDAIPRSVGIVYIIRHPYDVLTSYNPNSARKYHVTPDRWLGEMQALKRLIDTRPHTLQIVTYEQLVRDPQSAIAAIGETFGLQQAASASRAISNADLPQEAVAAMHGVRPIDQASVGRYASDESSVAYLRSIVPELRETLNWCAERFGYDLALPVARPAPDTSRSPA